MSLSKQSDCYYLFADAECLQRAVEGRAASDEEEEDRGLMEVKKHISRLHSCGKGLVYIHHTHNHPNPTCFPPTISHVTLFSFHRCQSHVVQHPPSQRQRQDENLISTLTDSRGRCSWKGQNPEKPEGGRAFEEEKVCFIYFLFPE